MTQKTPNNALASQLDRADTRVRHDAGLLGALRGFLDQVRSGNLGMLPVVIGLVLISTVFSILNPIFLAPNNLVNLLFDAAAVGLIALGVVCVLLLGEIDLSIGSMSGLGSALMGVLWVNSGIPDRCGCCYWRTCGRALWLSAQSVRDAKFCSNFGWFARAIGPAALYFGANWVYQHAVHVAIGAVRSDCDYASMAFLLSCGCSWGDDRV
jgi:ribose/xylose/arabinose/galactoside ABC-type transport system permease subunit